MAAPQSDRLEREAGADHARVVVDVGHDREQRLGQRLREEQRERERRLARGGLRDDEGALLAVDADREGRDEVGGERERGALGVLFEDLPGRLRRDELELRAANEC